MNTVPIEGELPERSKGSTFWMSVPYLHRMVPTSVLGQTDMVGVGRSRAAGRGSVGIGRNRFDSRRRPRQVLALETGRYPAESVGCPELAVVRPASLRRVVLAGKSDKWTRREPCMIRRVYFEQSVS